MQSFTAQLQTGTPLENIHAMEIRIERFHDQIRLSSRLVAYLRDRALICWRLQPHRGICQFSRGGYSLKSERVHFLRMTTVYQGYASIKPGFHQLRKLKQAFLHPQTISKWFGSSRRFDSL